MVKKGVQMSHDKHHQTSQNSCIQKNKKLRYRKCSWPKASRYIGVSLWLLHLNSALALLRSDILVVSRLLGQNVETSAGNKIASADHQY